MSYPKINRIAVTVIILMVGTTVGSVSAAAPGMTGGDIYVPNRIKIDARIYNDWDARGLRNPPPRTDPQRVEAWYFEDVCIVSQVYPPLPGHPPEKWVYAYWHDTKTTGEEFPFQQWGSPRAQASRSYGRDAALLPSEAWRVNPLYYMVDFQKRKSAAGNEVKVVPGAAGTRIVHFQNEPYISEYRNETYDNNYLIHNDRVLSITLVMNTTYPPQKKVPNSVPPAAHSRLVYELNASDFDEQFPQVPLNVKKWAQGNIMVSELDSIAEILPHVTPSDVIEKATAGLQRIRLDGNGSEIRIEPEDFTILTLAGEKVNVRDLLRGKTALIYLWASWAPENLFNKTYGKEVKTSYDVLERLKGVYDRYGSDPDVVILGLSVDPDPAAAKAFADEHQLPWENYTVPALMRRAAIRTFGDGDELPSAIVINRGGENSFYGIRGIKGVLGNQSSGQLQAGYQLNLPFADVVDEDRAAKKAGGYAKHWLGEEVLDVLTNYDKVEVCALTGDHMAELLMAANNPPMLPPPPPGQPKPPAPTPRPYDMPTSVSVLGDFPVKEKAVVKDAGLAREVARMLMDDKAVQKQFGEESFPTYKRAITFRKGNNIVGVCCGTNDIQIFLNGEQEAWLWLSDEATEKLQKIYTQMAKAAGVRIEKK